MNMRKPINELNMDYINSASYEDRNRYAKIVIGQAAQSIRDSQYHTQIRDGSFHEQVDGKWASLDIERRMELADSIVSEFTMREIHEKTLLINAYTGGPYVFDNTDTSRITSRDDYKLVHDFWMNWWLPQHRDDYSQLAA